MKRKREEQSFDSKSCENVLKTLSSHPWAWIIEEPKAEYWKINKNTYKKIVKHPMGIKCIREKLEKKRYTSKEEFIEDVNMIWMNFRKFKLCQNTKLMIDTLEETFNILLRNKSDQGSNNQK